MIHPNESHTTQAPFVVTIANIKQGRKQGIDEHYLPLADLPLRSNPTPVAVAMSQGRAQARVFEAVVVCNRTSLTMAI